MISNIFFRISRSTYSLFSPQLEVSFFEFDKYLGSAAGPPPLLTPEKVVSQAGRVRVALHEPRILDPETEDAPTHDFIEQEQEEEQEDEQEEQDEQGQEEEERKIWVTVGLTRVCSPVLLFTIHFDSFLSRTSYSFKGTQRNSLQQTATNFDFLSFTSTLDILALDPDLFESELDSLDFTLAGFASLQLQSLIIKKAFSLRSRIRTRRIPRARV